MRIRTALAALTAASALLLTAACDLDSSDEEQAANSGATASASAPPASTPASADPNDAGLKRCDDFDGKLGPDLPARDDYTPPQLVAIKDDFELSIYPGVKQAGIQFIDALLDGKETTADQLREAASNLAAACQNAHPDN